MCDCMHVRVVSARDSSLKILKELFVFALALLRILNLSPNAFLEGSGASSHHDASQSSKNQNEDEEEEDYEEEEEDSEEPKKSGMHCCVCVFSLLFSRFFFFQFFNRPNTIQMQHKDARKLFQLQRRSDWHAL